MKPMSGAVEMGEALRWLDDFDLHLSNPPMWVAFLLVGAVEVLGTSYLGGSIPCYWCILPPTHSCVGPTAGGSHQLWVWENIHP